MKSLAWITMAVGVWLLVAAFAIRTMAPTGLAASNDVVMGLLLVLSSSWLLAAPSPAVAWFQVLCGIWLIVSPFMLGYGALTTSMSNAVACGAATFIVALFESISAARPIA